MKERNWLLFCSHDSCFIHFKDINMNLKIQITCLTFTWDVLLILSQVRCLWWVWMKYIQFNETIKIMKNKTTERSEIPENST